MKKEWDGKRKREKELIYDWVSRTNSNFKPSISSNLSSLSGTKHLMEGKGSQKLGIIIQSALFISLYFHGKVEFEVTFEEWSQSDLI